MGEGKQRYGYSITFSTSYNEKLRCKPLWHNHYRVNYNIYPGTSEKIII